jgi:hypothetical protein
MRFRPSAVVVLLGVAAGHAAGDTGDTTAPPPADARKLSPRTEAVMAAYSATYDGELTTRDLRLKGGVPLVRRDGFGVGLLLGYGLTRLGFATEDREEDLKLHRFEAMLGGGGALAPGRSLRMSIGTAYASDLRDSTWSALQFTSTAMLHWVLGPDDAILLGALYTSSPELSPVLPILGYVHQRDGSRFRFDMFLPRHVRAEYELHSCIRGALGIEALGNTWAVQPMQSQDSVRRAGGAMFGELAFRLTQHTRLEARIGVSVQRHTLPPQASDAMRARSLRPAGFTQLAFLIAP